MACRNTISSITNIKIVHGKIEWALATTGLSIVSCDAVQLPILENTVSGMIDDDIKFMHMIIHMIHLPRVREIFQMTEKVSNSILESTKHIADISHLRIPTATEEI